MKKIFIFVLLTLIIGFSSYQYVTKKTARPSENIAKVSATIFPLYDIVRNIAGDEIETVLILRPGASPHSFDPSPENIKLLQGSDTIFMIGHGIDDWALRLAESAGVRDHTIVDKNIKLMEFSGSDHTHEGEEIIESEEDHKDEGIDPHYWLSIENAKGIATQVKDELITRYPTLEDSINVNYAKYIAQLNELQEYSKDRMKALDNKNIATFHNAWSYFAQENGLTIITTFEEFPGEEPTPEYLSEFIEHIEADKISVIYAEPQFSTATLEPIAKDLGVKISVLDPIGGVPGRESYINLLRYNGMKIKNP